MCHHTNLHANWVNLFQFAKVSLIFAVARKVLVQPANRVRRVDKYFVLHIQRNYSTDIHILSGIACQLEWKYSCHFVTRTIWMIGHRWGAFCPSVILSIYIHSWTNSSANCSRQLRKNEHDAPDWRVLYSCKVSWTPTRHTHTCPDLIFHASPSRTKSCWKIVCAKQFAVFGI